MKIRHIFFLFVLFLLAGCVNIPREKIEISRYSLDPPLMIEPSDTSFALAVHILPFIASAEQHGDRILFKGDQHRMDYYFYHRWIIAPEGALTDILASDLLQWGMFGDGVFQQEIGLVPTHEIGGRLIDLYANNVRGEESAVLEVKLTVMRVHPGTYMKMLVYQKSYRIVESRQDGSVDSFVLAANAAIEQWLALVRYDMEALFLEEVKVFNKMNKKQPGTDR
ncbi:ABC-type transport auxiliary lipoprotein family protein [bacterium]|nr:ABC-type transport auxiliary lipoprotein family protein [bacterium]